MHGQQYIKIKDLSNTANFS